MLYFHVPFCRQKCSYCNFHFSTSLQRSEEMIAAMKQELFLRKNEMSNDSVSSVYLGGGTPSILGGEKIHDLLSVAHNFFDIEKEAEITLEANPEDLTKDFLIQIKNSGINRLSVGIQSFFDEDLTLMNRSHNAKQAQESIKLAQDLGFENISIDLIYGSPVSGIDVWKKNVEMAVDLGVPHISSYALTPEPKTALSKWIKEKKIASPDENLQSEEFTFLSNYLREEGFIHYEISNFAKPGKFSKHNSAYWQSKPYLGIGPSAHSFDGNFIRSWNVANNAKYIKEIKAGELPITKEILRNEDRLNEMIMTGLRTVWGLNLNEFRQRSVEKLWLEFQKNYSKKITENLLETDGDFLKIPYSNWFLADGISADLFLD